MVIGSIKSGTSGLWSQLVDMTEGAVVSGGVTHKGEISRKEKDFFGDPSQWRHGRAWYERVWPRCPPRGQLTIGVDATPAYHVWHDAPANMAAFFGPSAAPRLRLVWLLRDPVAKAWSYFWELKSYGGSWDSVAFGPWVSKHTSHPILSCPARVAQTGAPQFIALNVSAFPAIRWSPS